MVSETRDFNSLSSLLYSSEDIRSSTEAGFWKSDNLPGYYDSDQGTKPSLDVQAVSNFSDSSKVKMIATQHESSLFSSSLSELFRRKLRLSANNALHGHSVDTVAPHYEEERLFNSLEELEAQIIGNLLPNDDDLLSGVTDGLDHNIHDSAVDDMDELDLFSSVGGMDLGDDDISSSGEKDYEFLGGACNSPLGLCNASITGEHPYSEHPSRTLFVTNINNDVENSELIALFEQFGDIHTLYTACKHHGSVMISFYDIRAAQNAMKAHQNRLFRCRKFDIHYLIPKDSPSKKVINQDTLAVLSYDSSVSNNELHRVFNAYGEIKEICENPQNRQHKLIEFYDVRAAEAALHALNRNDTTRKRLKVEPSRHRDPESSPGQLNFDIEAASAFHPRSLPECHDGLANGVHCNPPEVAVNINLKSQERIDNMQFCQVNSNGRFMEFNECVFKSSGNGSCPLPGHHYKWNNSYQPPRMMWPNSPSYFHAAPTLPRLHGLPRSPSHMMSTVLSVNNQHVPPVPLWERRHTYTGESPEASAFHHSSLGNIQFSSNSVTHCVDFASHNIFSHFGGNCVDLQILPRNVGLHFHNHMINSFDTHKQRARSHRNGVSNLVDKKQYELDIDRIDRGEDKRTTLMIKNIPNKYTSKMLLAAIDERHKGTYDFVYLPIDFKNKCNVGYAFINMINPSLIIPFYQVFNGKKWEKFNSEKVASLAYARIQGKAALIAHFQNSSLMNEDKRCRPILFNTDGPNAGDEVPFPVSVNVRNKLGSLPNLGKIEL